MVSKYNEIAELLKTSNYMKNLWNKYIKSNIYAKEIDFLNTVAIYEEIGRIVG